MPSISVEALSVDFAIYGTNSRSIKKALVSQATGGRLMGHANDAITIRALDSVSLEIANGERVGLLGHNGSGKTTLLRVLAGLYKPSRGRVALTGRVGALLDPNAGMDPDATGVENIYLRGRVLGLAETEITKQLDHIIAFTELANFIELPVRTYSAGMLARLAFAISTAIRPDILLMDEGIGAGDAPFMERVRESLIDLANRSPILVLATHDEGLIRSLCTRIVVLEHGRIVS